jgi:tetratricopeptide (TPR) repeat protein
MSSILVRLGAFAFACTQLPAATNLDLEIVLAPHEGTTAEDREIRLWQERASTPAATAEIFERLGWAYVAKARRTLDAGFHSLAARTMDVGDARFGPTTGARLLRGHVLHNLHRFREAELIARELAAQRGAAADLALLSDVLIEQGKLEEGVAVLQRAVDARPGSEAFARVAHVRWLKGDLAGAIAAAEMAIQAADTRGIEAGAWLMTKLSGLRLQAGDASSALQVADTACSRVANYPPALLARGRALIALGRNEEAIAALERAASLHPLPEYLWWLADALSAGGKREQARAVERQLERHGATEDPRTFALFLATRGTASDQAIRLARAELAERQDVFSRDALAWALLAAGDLPGAETQMRFALVEGTRDARLYLHAGEIALARGEQPEAMNFFSRATSMAATLTPSERALLARRTSTAAAVASD